MENNTNLSSSSQNALNNSPLQGFGNTLRQARENKNISLDDAAKELFILKRHLQAIESEDYNALPQRTFARGFVVNYAKFLGVDSVAMAQSFDANYPDHLQPGTKNIKAPMQPIGTLQRESRGKIKINPWLIGALLLALGLGIFLFKTINKAHNDTQTPADTQSTIITPQDQATGASLGNTGSAVAPVMPTTTIAQSSTQTTVQTTTQATQPLINNETVPSTNLTNSGSAIDMTTTASAVSPTQALAMPTTGAPIGSNELEFWVQNNTNVSVTDATGNVLAQGTRPRGGFTLHGQPPFNINIDKVSNVKLNYNKEPIKLDPYAQNNQASFRLS